MEEEQKNLNLENNVPEENDEIQTTTTNVKKSIPKKAIIITSVAIAGIALALILIFVVFKHEHTWTKQTCTEGSYCTECGKIQSLYGYGHSFGEWTTITERTCTQVGIKERVCACGKKETQTLSSGHNFANYGICLDCNYGWVNINLPETPLAIEYTRYNRFEFSTMRYELGRYDSGYLVRIFYSGTQTDTYQNSTQDILFYYKLVDSEGYTVCSGHTSTPALNPGDKVKDKYFDIKYIDLDPNETYTLVITD